MTAVATVAPQPTPTGIRATLARHRPPLYPMTFAAAYMLNFWSASAVYPMAAVRPLVVALLVAFLICLVAGAIAGRTRGGLAASAVIVGLVAPGGEAAAPLALFAFALLVLVEGAIHRNRPLKYGWLIDRVMLVLATIVLLAVGIKIVNEGALGRAIEDVQLVMSPRGPVAAPATKPPDIVMVMLDGFPGDAAAKLATKAGSPYDPDAFPAALADLGFNVQRDSHSNYLLTPMTLASMLDMRHLVDVPGLVGGDEQGGQGRRFRKLLNGSTGLEDLHRAGYELIWVDAGFNHVEARRVDRWIDHGQPNELEVRILALTFGGHLLDAVAPDLLSDLHRQRIATELADISSLIDEPHDQPRFVFIHVPSPHSPWVFGPNGEPRREGLNSFFADFAGARGIERDEAIRRVFDQATYLGKQTATEVGKLVDRPNPPAVVIFSDHGPGTEINFADPASTDLVERSSNFLATFTPGHPDAYDEFTTPVNILPPLFKAYLGIDVARNPDTIYAWQGSELNLFPVDVTGTNAR